MDAADTSPRRPPLSLPVLVAQILATAALLVWLLVLHRPLGWPGQWAYRVNARPWAFGTAMATVTILAALAVMAYAAGKFRPAGAALLLVWLPIVYFSLAAMNPAWLRVAVAYQASDVSTGYLAEAYRIDSLPAYLRGFSPTSESGAHLRTKPPGATLIYYALRRFDDAFPAVGETLAAEMESASGDTALGVLNYARSFPGAKDLAPGAVSVAILAILVICAATSLSAALLFWIVAGRYGPLRGYLAAALLGLSPACALFCQCLDMLIVLAAVVMIAAMGEGWPSLKRSFVIGALLGLASTISLSALALGVALVCVAAGPGLRGWRTAKGILALVGGFVAVLVLMAVIGLNPVEVFSNALAAHGVIAGEHSRRSYGIWVWMNVVEFAVFLGLPTVVALVRRRKGLMTPAYMLAFGAVAALVAVSLNGMLRGETGRILAPLMPLLIFCLAELEERPWALGVTTLLLLVQTVGMSLAMQPVSTPF